MSDLKPGYQTTEFALTGLTLVGTVLSFILGKRLDLTQYEHAVITVTFGAVLLTYIVARIMVKMHWAPGVANDMLKVVDHIDPGVENELKAVFHNAVADAVAPASAAAGQPLDTTPPPPVAPLPVV